MTEISVVVTGPEEAYNNEAEFWHGNEGRATARGLLSEM